MSKTTNKYSAEVRERAVRMVLDNAGQHDSRWSAILSISSKIGCPPQTLNEWVKKAEVDRGNRGGVTTDMTDRGLLHYSVWLARFGVLEDHYAAPIAVQAPSLPAGHDPLRGALVPALSPVLGSRPIDFRLLA